MAVAFILNFPAVLTQEKKESAFWLESLIFTFYLLKKDSIRVSVQVNLDFRALAVNGTDRLWNIPTIETGRAQSNDERQHIHMQVNTMFPDTPAEKAWLYEILLNLRLPLKKKKKEKKTSNLPSDLSCIGFGSVKLEISHHISVRSGSVDMSNIYRSLVREWVVHTPQVFS